MVACARLVHLKTTERDVEHLAGAPDVQGWVNAVAARFDGLRAVEGGELVWSHGAAHWRFNQAPYDGVPTCRR